jgi:hypothetical protein
MASAWPYEGACVVIEPLQQPIFAVPKPTPFARIIPPAPATMAKIALPILLLWKHTTTAWLHAAALQLGCLLARCNGLRVERRQIYYQKL